MNSKGLPSIEETGQTIFETTITTVAGISAGFLAAFPGRELLHAHVLTHHFCIRDKFILLPSILVAEHTVRDLVRGVQRLEGDAR